MSTTEQTRGPLAWMARNTVAANLLILVIIGGGILSGLRVKQEVFPEVDLDVVQVSVPYPGASPAEVEQGIVLVIEEAVRGLDGVRRVTSKAFEGQGAVLIELLLGTDANRVLQDIKNAIDRITSFPEDAERPLVSLLSNRFEVISLILYGDLEEYTLRVLAEQVRDELLVHPEITQVELSGVRPLEISIEISQATLRAHDLTLEEVAHRVAQSAIELPGGGVKTRGGEVLLRTAERRDLGREFADILLLSDGAGTEVRLGEVAQIVDGFADTEDQAFFNGLPAVRVNVYRVGSQTPKEVADAVKEYVGEFRERFPEVGVATWLDWSQMLSERLGLLMRNASLGLVLVLLILGVFLQPNLAGWVTLGIPVSILGGLLLMPTLDVSINMISLFAFILTLGIIVDDAIVVGENIYERRRSGRSPLTAAIEGVQRIATPVTFSVLTNIVAFVPLLVIPGVMGKFFRVIPLVVIPVLIFSLVESLFVLPAHLGHRATAGGRGPLRVLAGWQQRFSQGLEYVIHDLYAKWLRSALRSRYLTATIGLAILLLTVGYVASGRIDFTFMPRVDSDLVAASAVLPYGTNVKETETVRERLLASAHSVIAEHGGDEITRGIFTQIGNTFAASHARGIGAVTVTGGHLVNAQVYMVPSDEREISASEFASLWRERVGEMPGLEALIFDYSTGPSGGADIDVELSHRDTEVLEEAAADLAEVLGSFAGVTGIDDGFLLGKPQLDFRIRPEGRSLGITASDLGRQLRSTFYGAEAIRQQRGRNEIKVMVRFPEAERRSEYNVEELLIRSPERGEIPLMEAAEIHRGRAYTEIKRAEGRRVVNVTADVVPGVANANKVIAVLKEGALPELVSRYPGLGYGFEGEQRSQRESMESLRFGFVVALFVIFALLAVVFRSYAQPVIVMVSIPFGFVGAVLGHLLMGFELSMISMMGVVALSGVVVNDSLVLVDATNRRTRSGAEPLEAIVGAGVRRFRPIILTSLTTFFGLLPMIFEQSVQARFLIPMAISLGYGILFATFIVLLLVPALYLISEDARRLIGRRRRVDVPE